MSTILDKENSIEQLKGYGGGKATHLAVMAKNSFAVPDWFCVSSAGFHGFLKHNNLDCKLKEGEDLKAFAASIRIGKKGKEAPQLPYVINRSGGGAEFS